MFLIADKHTTVCFEDNNNYQYKLKKLIKKKV